MEVTQLFSARHIRMRECHLLFFYTWQSVTSLRLDGLLGSLTTSRSRYSLKQGAAAVTAGVQPRDIVTTTLENLKIFFLWDIYCILGAFVTRNLTFPDESGYHGPLKSIADFLERGKPLAYKAIDNRSQWCRWLSGHDAQTQKEVLLRPTH